MNPVARFTVLDDDRNLILGKVLVNGELKQGHVYQIEDFLGELTIRDMGLSSANKDMSSSLYGHDANSYVNYGTHLYTNEELELKYELERQERLNR